MLMTSSGEQDMQLATRDSFPLPYVDLGHGADDPFVISCPKTPENSNNAVDYSWLGS